MGGIFCVTQHLLPHPIPTPRAFWFIAQPAFLKKREDKVDSGRPPHSQATPNTCPHYESSSLKV